MFLNPGAVIYWGLEDELLFILDKITCNYGKDNAAFLLFYHPVYKRLI